MRGKRFWILPLILLSLALTPILAQESTPQSKPDLTQASPQDSPIYTEAQVVQALKVGIQAALDKAVPLAVQVAVAQKEGERAAAQSLADQWKAEALKSYNEAQGWQVAGIAGLALGIAGLVYGLTR
jgi:hypothetical protein